jgi:hypothetical protein
MQLLNIDDQGPNGPLIRPLGDEACHSRIVMLWAAATEPFTRAKTLTQASA